MARQANIQERVKNLALLSADEIKKDQDQIRVNLVALDKQIHQNAVQCLMHCEKYRDTSLMRRLLVEIVDAKSGYRRQGLIVWMRTFSPMRLSGDTINMSGEVDGEEAPFQITKAEETPFWTMTAAREFTLRPIYQQGPLGRVEAAIRDFKKAIENTDDNGEPINEKEPFYDGRYTDEMQDFFEQVQKLLGNLPEDHTKDVREAEEALRKAEKRLAAG